MGHLVCKAVLSLLTLSWSLLALLDEILETCFLTGNEMCL